MAREFEWVERMWQAPCDCWFTDEPIRRPWFYKPMLYWYGWKTLRPFWLGGDEWCRRTLVIGWNFTGQIVIPLRHCRGCESCSERLTIDGLSIPLREAVEAERA